MLHVYARNFDSYGSTPAGLIAKPHNAPRPEIYERGISNGNFTMIVGRSVLRTILGVAIKPVDRSTVGFPSPVAPTLDDHLASDNVA